MILCLCHRVTDHEIADRVVGGCRSFEELQDETRVATGCGACECDARQAFDGACVLRFMRREEAQAA